MKLENITREISIFFDLRANDLISFSDGDEFRIIRKNNDKYGYYYVDNSYYLSILSVSKFIYKTLRI